LEDAALANQFLDQPYDVSIRLGKVERGGESCCYNVVLTHTHLVPVRSTNTQHLRDGFLRLLLQRMRDQSLTEEQEKEILGAIAEFKSNFVSMRVPKDTEFIFTKTKEGGLKMSYEVKKKKKKDHFFFWSLYNKHPHF
jgi:hypothetical protein